MAEPVTGCRQRECVWACLLFGESESDLTQGSTNGHVIGRLSGRVSDIVTEQLFN